MTANEYIRNVLGERLRGREITFSAMNDSTLVLILDDGLARLDMKAGGEIRLEDAAGVTVYTLKIGPTEKVNP